MRLLANASWPRLWLSTYTLYIWGVSRKLATSVNQGDTILTMVDVLKCTKITLLKSYWTTDRRPILNTFLHWIITGLQKSVNPVVMYGTYPNIYTTSIRKWRINANKMHTYEQLQCNIVALMQLVFSTILEPFHLLPLRLINIMMGTVSLKSQNSY